MPNKGQLYLDDNNTVKIPSFTQAQIDALSLADGAIVYNSTDNALNVSQNGVVKTILSINEGGTEPIGAAATLFIQTADKTVVNTTSPTSIIGTGFDVRARRAPARRARTSKP